MDSLRHWDDGVVIEERLKTQEYLDAMSSTPKDVTLGL